jgi:hypothetical protein
METSEIIDELQSNDKWLNNEFKQSKYYHEYLDKINEALKQ